MYSAIASLLFLTKQSFSAAGEWDYDHMSEWSHSYSMCDNEDQSPIDIDTGSVIYDDHICTSLFEWDVDYTKHSFKVSNNAHSIVLTAVEETSIDLDHILEDTTYGQNGSEYVSLTLNENTIATFPNYFQPEDSEHDSFCLHSMHFHWGLSDNYGSEHFIDGHQYALELHFVHYSCHHANLGTTLKQFATEKNVTEAYENGEDTHQLGVVAVFFDIVEDEINPAFEAMFEELDLLKFPDDSQDIAYIADVDLAELIPQDIETAGYYAYEGSLTTPPCTNIVRWHVMNARGSIGASQIEMFRELMTDETHSIAPNYRDIQNNVNDVYACMEAQDGTEITAAERTTRIVVWILCVFSIVSTVMIGVICTYQAKKDTEMEVNNSKLVNM